MSLLPFVELRSDTVQSQMKSLAWTQPVNGDAVTCKSATSTPNSVGVMTHFCHP